MALLKKRLHIKKSGSESTCSIYTSKTEVGNIYVLVKVDNTNAYIPLGAVSHKKATAGRVKKSGTTYTILSSITVPYTKKTYTTAGTFTLTIPTGVTKVKVTLAGGGGGGGNNTGYHYSYTAGCKNHHSGYKTFYGGTGGKGGLYIGIINVTSNQTYTITVGAGGTATKAGGASKFGNLATANGGGAGGNAYSSSGDYYNGSNGTNGTPSGSGAAGGSSGGGTGGNGWVYVEYGEGIE